MVSRGYEAGYRTAIVMETDIEVAILSHFHRIRDSAIYNHGLHNFAAIR